MGGLQGQMDVYLKARETNGCAKAAGWMRQRPEGAARAEAYV